MTNRTIETSPQLYARIGGFLYLIIIVLGIFGEAFVRNRLIVSGDAAATAANIRSMEPLWRFHIAAELFLLICAVVLLWIFFLLLRPVSFALILSPSLADRLFPAILLPAFVGETSLCLWLLVKGVNVEKWVAA